MHRTSTAMVPISMASSEGVWWKNSGDRAHGHVKDRVKLGVSFSTNISSSPLLNYSMCTLEN